VIGLLVLLKYQYHEIRVHLLTNWPIPVTSFIVPHNIGLHVWTTTVWWQHSSGDHGRDQFDGFIWFNSPTSRQTRLDRWSLHRRRRPSHITLDRRSQAPADTPYCTSRQLVPSHGTMYIECRRRKRTQSNLRDAFEWGVRSRWFGWSALLFDPYTAFLVPGSHAVQSPARRIAECKRDQWARSTLNSTRGICVARQST